jgi:hypothetical protein
MQASQKAIVKALATIAVYDALFCLLGSRAHEGAKFHGLNSPISLPKHMLVACCKNGAGADSHACTSSTSSIVDSVESFAKVWHIAQGF